MNDSVGIPKEEIFLKKMQSYRDWIFKLNYSNNLFVYNLVSIEKSNMVRFKVGRGNNS